jgi:hypothetical protein
MYNSNCEIPGEKNHRNQHNDVISNSFNNQDHWVFGFCPLSGILKNTKGHSVSETESVSILRLGVESTYSAGSVRKS